MEKEISLSYIMTTRNKLPYLKEVMKRLMENIKPDEEIVVIDAASTDGSVKYLEELHTLGKIHQFVSEQDFGESHGFNKGFFLAKGSLIKLLSDDDVFCYDSIQKCKQFMLTNDSFDCITGGIASLRLNSLEINEFIIAKEYELSFTDWINKKTDTCFFGGLALMIRRSSLTKLGLLDLSYTHVDLEYCTRLTFLKSRIAYYTALHVIALRNDQSKSVTTKNDVLKNEWNRVDYYYNKTLVPLSDYTSLALLKIITIRIIKKLKKIMTSNQYKNNSTDSSRNESFNFLKPKYNSIEDLFSDCDNLLRDYNNSIEPKFIYE